MSQCTLPLSPCHSVHSPYPLSQCTHPYPRVTVYAPIPVSHCALPLIPLSQCTLPLSRCHSTHSPYPPVSVHSPIPLSHVRSIFSDPDSPSCVDISPWTLLIIPFLDHIFPGLSFRTLSTELLYLYYPSKHETLTQCWVDVGPSSTTLDHHQLNIGSTSRICWDRTPSVH